MDENKSVIFHCEEVARQWLSSPLYDAETKSAVQSMLDDADKTNLIAPS